MTPESARPSPFICWPTSKINDLNKPTRRQKMNNMTASADYRTSSRAMMAQSRTKLAEGDLPQTSENGREVAALTPKATTEQRR